MFIINIEGTDGSGKYTQSSMLKDKLISLGVSCKLHSFPSYDAISSGPVKMYLGGEFGSDPNTLDAYQASSLFAVDRLCTMKLMQNSLTEEVLILDRYTSSNMIHQANKIDDPIERQKVVDWIASFEYDTLRLPKPDIVLFLDMPSDMSKKLANSRSELKTKTKMDIHEQNKQYLDKSYSTGKEVAKKLGWKEISCVNENNDIRSREEIHEEILKIILPILSKKLEKNLI